MWQKHVHHVMLAHANFSILVLSQFLNELQPAIAVVHRKNNTVCHGCSKYIPVHKTTAFNVIQVRIVATLRMPKTPVIVICFMASFWFFSDVNHNHTGDRCAQDSDGDPHQDRPPRPKTYHVAVRSTTAKSRAQKPMLKPRHQQT